MSAPPGPHWRVAATGRYTRIARVMWFMPLTFIAGIDGFDWFMPYLLAVVALAALRGGMSRYRASSQVMTSASILSEFESASA